MKHIRNGFTLVEVSLFLGVSGLLIIGVLAMTHTSISQQRFNDATQSFAEFLRSVYSETMNPQSIGSGRSEELAVYGKMITFGEKFDLAGNEISNEQKFFVYDVVGGADVKYGWSGGDVSKLESWLKTGMVNVVVEKKLDDGDSYYVPAGIVEEYIPKWESAIDSTKNSSPFRGTILILRRPQSGTVSTFVSDEPIQVNGILNSNNQDAKKKILFSNATNFKFEAVDFCVNMSGFGVRSSDMRRDIRIIKDARNTSGVELIDLDSSDNKCEK